jgi:hypothetical protein
VTRLSEFEYAFTGFLLFSFPVMECSSQTLQVTNITNFSAVTQRRPFLRIQQSQLIPSLEQSDVAAATTTAEEVFHSGILISHFLSFYSFDADASISIDIQSF